MAPNHRKAVRDSKAVVATATVAPKTGIMPGFQSTLFWGAASIAAAIIIAVITAKMKDSRPLLYLAWLFLIVAVWELARAAGFKKLRMISVIGALVSFFLLAMLYHFSLPEAGANQEQMLFQTSRTPLAMKEIFDSDFSGMGKIFTIQKVESYGNLYSFPATEYFDISANSYFLAFYIDREEDALRVCYIIATSLREIINNIDQVKFQVDTVGDTKLVSNSTMNFSRQVYIYINGELDLDELHGIEQMFNHYSIQIHFRNESYYMLHWREFDRVPHSAEAAGGTGVQLPKAEVGISVKVTNGMGSLPRITTVLPDLPFPVQGRPVSPARRLRRRSARMSDRRLRMGAR